MPTTIWILETIEDRYYESHRGPSVPYVPPVFSCHQCGQEFDAADDLAQHLSIHHPVGLPVLYLNGKPLLRESVIRSVVSEGSIRAFQCTECRLQEDAGPWTEISVPQFCERFSRVRNSTWSVRLLNVRPDDGVQVNSDYEIRFRIPEDDSLRKIDQRFVETLVRDTLGHVDLRRFEAHLPTDASAREYGGALGDYVLGILLKERRNPPRSGLEFREFVSKMASALEVLRVFDRPVAQAVSSCVCFNLNGFQTDVARGPELEAAFEFFRRVLGTTGPNRLTAPTPWPPGGPVQSAAICPVDVITHRLLRACAFLSNGGKIPQVELESLGKLVHGSAPISEQDLGKIHVICAEGFARLGRRNEALEHLRAIQFDSSFRDWAHQMMEDGLPHGN